MKKRIQKIHILSVIKMVSIIYGILTLLLWVIPFYFMEVGDVTATQRLVATFLYPVFMILAVVIMSAGFCFLYNYFAKKIGGIIITVIDE